MPDEPLGALALDIMARATVAQLRDDALELAKLWSELPEVERAKLLALVFGVDL